MVRLALLLLALLMAASTALAAEPARDLKPGARVRSGPCSVGAPVHDLELYDLDDRLFSLKRVRKRARLVVVDFFSASCAPCKRALPAWQRALKHHAAKGLALVVVAVPDGAADRAEDLARVKRVFSRLRPRLPVVWDKYSLVAKRYGVARRGSLKLPQVFLVDPRGKLLLKAVEPGPVLAEIKRRLKAR